MPRLSGLQLQVLHLYRRCLRAAYAKPPETRSRFIMFARQQFRRSDVGVKDVAAVEHLLRVGERQLAAYAHPSVRNITI